MEKVQAIGAPFVIEHSSCSDLKPKTFQWTLEDCPIKVFIDGAIMSGIEYVKKEGEVKVAWVCESRTIFHTMHVPRDTWMNNLEKICEVRKCARIFYWAIEWIHCQVDTDSYNTNCICN